MPTWQHFLALLAPRFWPLEKSLGASKTEAQTLVERSNFFSIKYSECDNRTLIIYFNELLSSPLEWSFGFCLSVRPAKCEEAVRYAMAYHDKKFENFNMKTLTRIACPTFKNWLWAFRAKA